LALDEENARMNVNLAIAIGAVIVLGIIAAIAIWSVQ
jgi:hypothetical protein